MRQHITQQAYLCVAHLERPASPCPRALDRGPAGRTPVQGLSLSEEIMQSLVNHLLQLQELILVRDEHRATGDGSHLERLGESIDELTDKLPPPVKASCSG